MNRVLTLVFCLLIACAWGCKKDDKKKGEAEHPPKQPPVEQPAPIADEDLAVPADFDEEAETQITAENYKAELDALEKEINAEP
jgi:hypothetical protein